MQMLLNAKLEGFEVKKFGNKKITEFTLTQEQSDSGHSMGFGKKFFKFVSFEDIEVDPALIGSEVDFAVEMYSSFDGKTYRVSKFGIL